LKILVTGCAGFIGYHLCRRLLSEGYEVHCIDNLCRGIKERVNELISMGLKFYKIDVRDYTSILKLPNFDAIIHLAALINVEESFREPILYNEVNVNGTLNLIMTAIKWRVSSFIYASSAAVYGNPKYLPIDENHPTNPLSPYGASKLASEYYIKSILGHYNIRYVILRLFNVYGPGQVANEYASVIVKFIDRVSRGLPPIIYGDGHQTRDFIYIDDVVSAIISSLRTNVQGVFNIASGKAIKIKDLAEMILDLYGKRYLGIIYTKPRPGDIKYSVANIDKAIKNLKWSPKTSLRNGLKNCIKVREKGG